jgi:uncharacterized protein (DUF1501 family)
MRAIGFGGLPQRSLSGSVPVSALRSIADFHFGGDPRTVAHIRASLNILYANDLPGQETLRILDILQKLDVSLAPTASATVPHYPTSNFGLALQQTAMLVKAEIGLEVAAIDLGGWDTHFAQSQIQPSLIQDLAGGLAAFHADMAGQMNKLTLVTMSEFGRRAAENGSLGTDHGHGSMMMVMGGHIKGGRVYGQWPGLKPGQVVGPGDLAVTTDYRVVLGEIIHKRLNNLNTDQIFPGYDFVPQDIVAP